MSFVVENETLLPYTLDEVFEKIETSFIGLMKLSSTTESIEIIKTDKVALKEDLSYNEVAILSNVDDVPEIELCPRIHFRLVERVKVLRWFSKQVVVVGTQITSYKTRRFLYESSANDDTVLIRKVRTFEALNDGSSTLVKERIDGKVYLAMLRDISFKECQKAHSSQMSRYLHLFDEKPAPVILTPR